MNGPASNGRNGERTFLGHPLGLYLLFLVEMWERFSYYGMRMLLVLYLIATFSVVELPHGQYVNELEVTELRVEEGKDVDVGSRRQALHVLVGDSAANQPDAGVRSVGEPLRLNIVRVVRDPNSGAWTPDGDGTDSAYVFQGPVGGPFRGGDRALEITNPTDQPIKVRIGAIVPESDPRPFFKLNDRPTAIVTEIKPDAIRSDKEPPFRVTIGTNNVSSGRYWTRAQASTLYGWYTGLAYLFPILGGIVADRLIGTHRSMLVGGLLITIGHIVLGVSGMGELAHNQMGMSLFIAGLAVIVLGTGHFKPTVSVMVGQLYQQGDPRRDGAFTIFYMGINLGAFLCAFVCGTLGETVGWHWGFGSAAVGMLLGLLLYVMGKEKFLSGIGEAPVGGANRASVLFFFAAIALSGAFGALHFGGALAAVERGMEAIQANPLLSYALIFGLSVVLLTWVGWFVVHNEPEDRGPVVTIFVFMLFNAFFWIAFEQAGSSLNIFTEQNTDRRLGNFEVPATWFQSVNAGLIFILAPIFSAIWTLLGQRGMNPSQPVKIALGLIFLGIGYLFMVVAGQITAGGAAKAGMFFIMMTYFWHTVGELCLSPTGLSYVTKTAPVRFVSLLMGIWFVSSFIANLGGGLLAAQVEAVERGTLKLPWNFGGQADFFFLFVVTSIGAGLVVLVLTPYFKTIMRPNVD